MELRIGMAAGLVLAAILTQGCATRPPTIAPMRTLEVDVTRGADTLVVMLPGLRDRAEVFRDSGFFAARAEDFDVLAADAHWGYYADGSLVERLHDDVIAPARRSGYKHIWLLGVSLGGYGSLLYAEQFPEDIEGIVLLAPYLGSRRYATEISAAGGLTSWSGDTLDGERFAAGWRSLHTLLAKRDRATIILGYGASDRLAATYDPLVQALPASQVYTVAGDHAWTTWTPLWTEIKAAGTISGETEAQAVRLIAAGDPIERRARP